KNQVYFNAYNNSDTAQLWKSDGSSAGTALIKTFNSLTYLGDQPHLFTVSGGLLYFVVKDSELWKTDGTPAGTTLVLSFPNGIDATAPLGSEVAFIARDASSATELWISNGTPTGTSLLKHVPIYQLSILPPLLSSGSRVFFAAKDAF